jgi:hypothetical protein
MIKERFVSRHGVPMVRVYTFYLCEGYAMKVQ